jgi:hypothetical protein
MPGDNPSIYHDAMNTRPSDASDRPRKLELTLPAREWSALVMLRDTTFPGQSLELLARKLVQDGLIGCGVLSLPEGNRGTAAGRK